MRLYSLNYSEKNEEKRKEPHLNLQVMGVLQWKNKLKITETYLNK